MVQRLCGICPVSHHLAACKALDQVVGATTLTPTAEKIRRLMHYGQILQSHALHFFHLSSPDLLFGFGSDVARRNIVGVAAAYPDIARQGVLLRKYGQEVIRLTAGKRIHGTGSVPGGVNKSLTAAERDELLKDIYQMIAWSRDAVRLVRQLFEQDLATYRSFGTFEARTLSLVRADGAMDLYHGGLRARDADGGTIFDHVDYGHYWEQISEEVKAWSYMKFPYLRALGHENGWYRVGPLTRVTRCDFIPTPLADRERREFMAFDDGTRRASTLGFHWARMIEMLHAAEAIKDLLHDGDLLGTDLMAGGKRQARGVGVIEAPRGTLIHHYRVDEDDQVVRANLIVSTTHNNQAMNVAIREVARAVPRRAHADRGPAQPHRGRHPRVRSLPVLRDARARQDAAGGGTARCRRLGRRLDGARMSVAPTLVFAVGNPSRGDDAVGPLLAERLEAAAVPGVEVLVDFQWQVEHALDLAGRERVIFIDACVDAEAPFVEREVRADAGFAHTSHSLAPAQVLETYRRVTGASPPPALLFGVRAHSFELGAGLSPDTERASQAAWPRLLELCRR